jgi:ketosteroid isomerase-like protein
MLEKSESENIATINRIYELLATKDLPAIFSMLSPDIYITQSTEMPWGGTYVGISEAEMLFEKLSVYLNNRPVVERVIDGGNRIPVIGQSSVTIQKTGRVVEIPFMHLWEFKDGLAIRVDIVYDISLMREALGRIR